MIKRIPKTLFINDTASGVYVFKGLNHKDYVVGVEVYGQLFDTDDDKINVMVSHKTHSDTTEYNAGDVFFFDQFKISVIGGSGGISFSSRFFKSILNEPIEYGSTDHDIYVVIDNNCGNNKDIVVNLYISDKPLPISLNI